MSYFVNQSVFANMFPMPAVIADNYLKLATEIQLKVIIYIFRDITKSIDADEIAKDLSLPSSEVADALIFWQQCGIIASDTAATEQTKEKNAVVTAELPTRADVIKRGLEDERLMFLLREAQLKFGRNLKQNESQLLVSLYDDHGMDVSVILLLLQYAASENKCNVSFIRSTATRWIKQGVENVVEAENVIADTAKNKLAWSIVQRVFGIERRNPSDKELELSNLWVNEWKLSTDMLKLAYDACVNAKTRLSMPYIAKILEAWHKAGYKTPAEVESGEKKVQNKPQKSNDFAGYDLNLFEKMLNED